MLAIRLSESIEQRLNALALKQVGPNQPWRGMPFLRSSTT